MSRIKTLVETLPSKGITIISGYSRGKLVSYVALYRLDNDNSLVVEFPKQHLFSAGQAVTLHLDNRTGVSEYDAELRVFRVSYKGTVVSVSGNSIEIRPDEFMLFYSNDCVLEYKAPGFKYDVIKDSHELPESPVTVRDLVWNEKEHENKLGVLVSRLPSRPHSSLMAFISNTGDDIFLITLKGLFKSAVLHSDNRCCFAIDHRAEFVFEKSYDWNYTIIEADALSISKDNPVYDEIQYHFVTKNPWESSFFLSPEIEMFHLKPRSILLPDAL